MRKSMVHLLGVALLITAIFVAWPGSNGLKSTAELPPPTHKTIKNTHLESLPSRPETEPILETPLITIHDSGSTELRLSSAEEFQSALAQVLELPTSLTRDKAIATLIAQMAPQKAMEIWLNWEHARTQPWLQAASAICLKLAEEDPFGPADFINAHIPKSARFRIWARLFQKMDFRSTADVLETLPIHRESIKYASHIARNWIQTDPDACLSWLDRYLPQLSSEQIKILLESNRISIGKQKPDLKKRIAAFEQATYLPTREYLARLVLKTKTPDSDTQNKFLADLATSLPDLHQEIIAKANSPAQKIFDDPHGFAESLDSHKFESLSLRDWIGLISRLKVDNPEMAAQTLLKFGDRTGDHLSETLTSWHQVDAPKALAFTKNLPKTKANQKAIYNFATKIAHVQNEAVAEQLIALLSSAEDQKKIRAMLNDKRE